MRVTRTPASRVIRAAMFYAFAQEVRSIGDKVPPQVFSDILSDAIDNYGVGATELADHFGHGRATISRWKSGDSSPSNYIRREVLRWLAERLEKEAMDNEELASSRVVELVNAARRPH